MTFLIALIAIVLVLLGIAGTVLPALPGAPLVFAGLFLGAWSDGFARVGWVTIAILALITLLAVGIDFVAGGFGARKLGASKVAVFGAFVGALVGLFFGFFGVIVGPFIGAAVGELLVGRNLLHAGKVGAGTWLGLVVGRTVSLSLVFMMLGVFTTAWFW
jgi:uncharacterized protein YqgC (DUF456 family)